jgi:hypothetical protein
MQQITSKNATTKPQVNLYCQTASLKFALKIHINNEETKMTAEEKIMGAGYEDICVLKNYSYDDALIGISHDDRAIYDFNKMVEWLMRETGFTDIEAIEWIEYNTIRALPYMGPKAPIIMYTLEELL